MKNLIKQFVIFSIAAACGFFSSVTFAQVQPVIGSLDVVDQTKILGWACVPGDPNTKVFVYLYSHTPATGYKKFATVSANTGRNDIGNSGLCGTGEEAYFHGFEYTIYPDSMIRSNKIYSISARVISNGVSEFLDGGDLADFSVSGLPTSSIWRTDLDNRNDRLVGMVDCIWPFKGANARGNTDPLDMWQIPAGPTVTTSWNRFPGQPTANATWCAKNDRVENPNWYWSQSNSATNASIWPLYNFWVVSANNEWAYSKVNSGPPSQSEPINASLYSLSADSYGFLLGIDNRLNGYHGMDPLAAGIPFLSVGSEIGRGTSGVIKNIPATGLDTYLEFDVRQVFQSINPNSYHDIAVYVESMWAETKRVIGVQFTLDTRIRAHWNWNAFGSFWYPGSEINFLGASEVNSRCALPSSALVPVLSNSTIGTTKRVSIPLRALFQCVNGNTIPDMRPGKGNLRWTDARSNSLPLSITGVHLAIEQGDGRPTDYMTTAFSKPILVEK